MPIKTSGTISASDINTELEIMSNSTFSLNGELSRKLAGKTSGSISFSDFYGKGIMYKYEFDLSNAYLVEDNVKVVSTTLKVYEETIVLDKNVYFGSGFTYGAPGSIVNDIDISGADFLALAKEASPEINTLYDESILNAICIFYLTTSCNPASAFIDNVAGFVRIKVYNALTDEFLFSYKSTITNVYTDYSFYYTGYAKEV